MSYTSYGNYNRTVRARTARIDSDGFNGCDSSGPLKTHLDHQDLLEQMDHQDLRS